MTMPLPRHWPPEGMKPPVTRVWNNLHRVRSVSKYYRPNDFGIKKIKTLEINSPPAELSTQWL